MDDLIAGDVPLTQAAPVESLQELYRQHRLALVRLGVLLLGDQAAAEDVVQDVFAGMWRSGTAPNKPGGAPAYLRRAVVNRCRSQVRRHMLARRKPPPTDVPESGPSDVIELADEHREVLVALAKLPSGQREVLILRYFSDLSVTEAAASLGLSEGTVKSQSARGMDKLRKLLDEGSAL